MTDRCLPNQIFEEALDPNTLKDTVNGPRPQNEIDSTNIYASPSKERLETVGGQETSRTPASANLPIRALNAFGNIIINTKRSVVRDSVIEIES